MHHVFRVMFVQVFNLTSLESGKRDMTLPPPVYELSRSEKDQLEFERRTLSSQPAHMHYDFSGFSRTRQDPIYSRTSVNASVSATVSRDSPSRYHDYDGHRERNYDSRTISPSS